MSRFKYRITTDIEVTTQQGAKDVREFLRAFVEEDWKQTQEALAENRFDQLTRALRPSIEHVVAFDVRAKRLDDWATIGPDLTLRIAAGQCPHCGAPFAEQVINQVPFICPACRKAIRVDGDGTVIT